jgi:hypothetical protein
MLKALRAAPCCLLALLPLPPGLPLPLGRYESGQLHWQSPATPAAGQFTADFDRALGLAEPFDRATAALDYVIRHASATGSAGAGSAGPDDG